MRFIKLFEDFGSDIEDEVEELFIELTSDYDFMIEVKTEIYILKNPQGWKVPPISRDKFQTLMPNVEYNIGFYVDIHFPNEFGDMTYEFKTIISQLGGSGWELAEIGTEPYHGISDIKEVSDNMVNGKRVWNLCLYFAGYETKKFTEIELIKYYKMSGWSEVDGSIFIEMRKEDLASLFIPEGSDYYSYLVDGDPLEYFHNSDGYTPDPKDLARQYSDVSYKNIEKLIELIIQECGGIDKFYEKFSEYLPEEKMDIETIAKNGRGVHLEKIFGISHGEFAKFRRVLDEIIKLISDWSVSAHEHENAQEIERAFETLLDKHLNYTTFRKMVTRFRTVDSQRKSWEEEKEFYRIKFDSDWLVDSRIDLGEASLLDVFTEWALDTIGKVGINPRLSDWGSIDEESLNAEISGIIGN